MKVITEITKNTYELTFNSEAEYEWFQIGRLFIESDDIYKDLIENALIKKNKSKEDVLSWRDLFFMEIAEQNEHLDDQNPLIKLIRTLPLFISNIKFINNLPKATAALGREILLDELIDNKNADQLIPDKLIEAALKKKSRDDLKRNFEEWNAEDEIKETVFVPNKSESEKIYTKKFSYLKYLIAACFIGAIAVIGYNNFNNGYDFEDSQFVKTSEKIVNKNKGLGFANKEEKGKSITIQIFDFNKAIVLNKSVSDKLVLHSYLFSDKELKLVLEDSNIKTEVVELEQSVFYLKINDKFFKIEKTNEFKNLEKLNDPKIIEQLERILFKNE
jgi:hypothetical protein